MSDDLKDLNINTSYSSDNCGMLPLVICGKDLNNNQISKLRSRYYSTYNERYTYSYYPNSPKKPPNQYSGRYNSWSIINEDQDKVKEEYGSGAITYRTPEGSTLLFLFNGSIHK